MFVRLTAATLFCPADEPALCAACDLKEHMGNKLASRHLRLDLPNITSSGKGELCDEEKAFFFCEKDGMFFCSKCDMVVLIGSKRRHPRLLKMRQKIELCPSSVYPEQNPLWGKPISRPSNQAELKDEQNYSFKMTTGEVFPASAVEASAAPRKANRGTKRIDLNRKPRNRKPEAPKR